MAIERSVRLTCHPAAHSAAVHRLEVRVRRSPDGTLSLAYRLQGAVALLRVPSLQTQRAADRLWEHTCFEAFIGLEGERAYHELDVSPSGEWAVFAFRDTRDGELLHDESLAPRIDFRSTDVVLELEACVSLDRLDAAYRDSILRIGLSAVVETNDGTHSYWALRHPAVQPDFHDAGAFALRLEAT